MKGIEAKTGLQHQRQKKRQAANADARDRAAGDGRAEDCDLSAVRICLLVKPFPCPDRASQIRCHGPGGSGQ
jgi:hypothetical protein